MTTPPNGTGIAGASLLPQAPQGGNATTTSTDGDVQLSDFTNVIRQALGSAETPSDLGTGVEETLVGAAAIPSMEGKSLPPTAEFAAESDAELNMAEAGALFSMLGLTLFNPVQGVAPPQQGLAMSGPREGTLDGDASIWFQPLVLRGQVQNGATGEAASQTASAVQHGSGQPPFQGQMPMPVAGAPSAQTPSGTPMEKLAAVVAPTEDATDEGEGALRFGQALASVPHPTTVVRPATLVAPPLETPLGEPGWDRGIGERILWMAGKSLQSASIQLNPRHLGPIEIQLSLQQDQASVSFHVHHAVTRDAIEAAIPRLREMFADNNLQLVNVDVGQRDPGGAAMAHQFRGGRPGDEGGDTAGDDSGPGFDQDEESATSSGHSSASGIGLLDDYA